MAEPSVLPAGTAGHQDITALADNSNVQPVSQDIEPSLEDYKPLPEGCWILPFHGNCPRCHHHHRAAEVQVKVTKDPKQVSHVRCERCQQKLAAFGGRNTTRISLLSTTTTEPDSMDIDLRYSLVQAVRVAVAKASLGTLPESPPPTPSRRASQEEPGSARSHASLFSEDLVAHRAAEQGVDADQEQHGSLHQTVKTPKEHAKLKRKSSRALKLFSKLKNKFTAHLSKLRRTQRKSRASYQTAECAAQREQSPTTVPRTETPSVSPAVDMPAVVHPHSTFEKDTVDDTHLIRGDADKPIVRFAEVAEFMKTLDKHVLAALNEQERTEWMRRAYADFKHRNKAALRLSSTTDTSTTPSTPSWPDFLHRLSNDILGAGAGLNEVLNAIEGTPRRHSIATSDGYSEGLSMLDGTTVVSIAFSSNTQPTQRPPSETGPQPFVVDRTSIHSHRRSLQSLEPPLHSRVASLTSLRSYAVSRLSQRSMTAYESITSIPATLLQGDERRPSNPEPYLLRPTSS